MNPTDHVLCLGYVFHVDSGEDLQWLPSGKQLREPGRVKRQPRHIWEKYSAVCKMYLRVKQQYNHVLCEITEITLNPQNISKYLISKGCSLHTKRYKKTVEHSHNLFWIWSALPNTSYTAHQQAVAVVLQGLNVPLTWDSFPRHFSSSFAEFQAAKSNELDQIHWTINYIQLQWFTHAQDMTSLRWRSSNGSAMFRHCILSTGFKSVKYFNPQQFRMPAMQAPRRKVGRMSLGRGSPHRTWRHDTSTSLQMSAVHSFLVIMVSVSVFPAKHKSEAFRNLSDPFTLGALQLFVITAESGWRSPHDMRCRWCSSCACSFLIFHPGCFSCPTKEDLTLVWF